MADKWEKSASIQNSELVQAACPVEEVSLSYTVSDKQNLMHT